MQLQGYVTNVPTEQELTDQYKSGGLTQDAYVGRMQDLLDYKNQQIDDEYRRNLAGEIGRAMLGGGLIGASMLPIMNVPYVGTGLGGGLFEWGNSILNKENARDTLGNIGKGFAIGEAIGLTPVAARGVNALSKGKIGEGLTYVGNKIAENPTVLRGTRNLNNWLSTDINGLYNPFKTKYNTLYDSADDFIDLTDAFNDPKLNLKNSLQDAKQFINEANSNEIAFETGSPDFFLDMLGNSKQRGHILKSDKVRQMNDTDKLNHNVIINNFDEVSKGLKPISNEPTINKKLNDKPNVESYYYFEGNVKNGDNIIPIIADAEKNFGEPLTKPQKLHLYNVYDKKYSPILNNKMSVTLGEDTNIINDVKQNINTKLKQLEIIQKNNPMLDDYHLGIRKLDDIKTFDEVINDNESFVWGDFSKTDAEKALKSGKITVYSSYPIKNGNFVSTSRNMARDYAGSGKIYSKEVNLSDVAWINGDEGQIAIIKD